MSSSTGRNRAPRLSFCTVTKRGTLLGTLTRANSSELPPAGSRSTTARFNDREEMYGNGCAGSTASGVRTGNTCSRKYVRSRSRSGASSSPQLTSSTPSADSLGRTSSPKQAACRVTRSAARAVIISSWWRSDDRSPPRIGSPALMRRFRPATRTM